MLHFFFISILTHVIIIIRILKIKFNIKCDEFKKILNIEVYDLILNYD